MAVRWIKNDRSGRIHSAALLSQDIPIPDELLQAVRETGGSIYKANPADSFLHRAVWLRNLASDFASFVVLHTWPSDVISGAAFRIKGGPPLMLVNYTAHTFWTGASVADLVVNVRGSALETNWTTIHRGIARSAAMPIPLLEHDPLASGLVSGSEMKLQAKKSIGIPADSVVILTV
jgi:hypothetical protein